MPVRLNFTGVTTQGFAPFPVNEEIPFTIFNITQETGKDSKEPYLKFEFKQVNGNRKAWRNYSLSPNALWALKKMLVDLDYDEDALEDEFEFEMADVMGKEVLLTFGPEKPIPNSDKMGQEIVKVRTA